jgi:threonyl-tRNA synthetase
MIELRLPDGRALTLPEGTTPLEVAERIGRRLAGDALAARLDGALVDLRAPLRRGGSIEIVTAKDPQAGEVIRHSAEHVMADAVKRLFPTCQIDVGRSDHSEKFQYDFRVDRPFSGDDLERIAKEMERILAEKRRFTREVVSREAAERLFREAGEELKLSRLADIPADQEISLFRHGDFVDLCRGPHVQRTDQIGAFRLIEAAGAYFRGDERNPMLQRIYGTAFATPRELEEHEARLAQARERDHRRVGAELGLFFVDPISPGSPFYLPKGVALYNGLVDFVRALYPRYGYQEVITPQVFRTELFKTSGHYQQFRDGMFLMQGDEGEELGLKPMNCPGHCALFSTRKHSYRELPIRFAEFTRLHRNERSGTLTGLSRVRSFAQDDAHIYCMPEQVEAELAAFFEMTREVYSALELSGVETAVSTRPTDFVGELADWDRAEATLERAVAAAGFRCAIKPGEAAFYGPKVECDFRDVLGRPWTLSTLQIDVAMPHRFGLRYVGADGGLHTPAMLHRAILGSLERFIALYTEMKAGDFPFWLAPVQVAVLPVGERQLERAREIGAALQRVGVRVEVDLRNEKLGFKVREAELQKIPLMLVIGDQEVKDGTATPRWRRGLGGTAKARALAVDALTAELVRATTERRSPAVAREDGESGT